MSMWNVFKNSTSIINTSASKKYNQEHLHMGKMRMNEKNIYCISKILFFLVQFPEWMSTRRGEKMETSTEEF